MSDIKPIILNDDSIVFTEVYESTPTAYSQDEGQANVVAIDVDDSVVYHSNVGEISSSETQYMVKTYRANTGALDYNPDDYSDFFVPGQSPTYTPNSANSNFDYTTANSLMTLKNTNSSVRSGGRGVYSGTVEGAKSHIVDGSGSYITRDIKNTSAKAVNLYECINIVPGSISGASSSKSLTSGYKGGYATMAGNLLAGQQYRYKIIARFDVATTCTVNIDFNYATYLKVAGQNFSRGKARYTLERYDNNKLGGVVKTLLSTTNNVGTRTHVNNLGNSHPGSKPITVPIELNKGRYAFVVHADDLYADTDKDANGYPFYAWASVNVKSVQTSTGYDNTYAVAEVIDLSTGSILRSVNVTSKNCSTYTVPQGAHYRVRYTLYRGNGKTGGLNGKGGSLYAYNGSISQDWQEYTFQDPTEQYPYTPPDTYEPPFSGEVDEGASNGGDTVPAPSIYCWLDAFRLYSAEIVEPEPDCFGESVIVTVKDGSTIVDEYEFTDWDSFIQFGLTNDSNTTKTYSIVFDYVHDCSGDPPIYLYGGKFIFDETREPDVSNVSINGLYVEQEKDVWYGAVGSNLVLNIYDATGNIIKSFTWDSSGEYTFDVTNLGTLPYSNYKAEFVTTQCGAVSPVTNIDYRAEFFIDGFRAQEIWKPIPLPFNSKLEFYIDNVLIGSWDKAGGGIIKTEVPKGNHEYKWVFTNNNLEDTWDFVEIDWFRLTNWICDAIVITPYCEPGKGDMAIEALLQCLLEVWKQRPEGCVFGNKKIWLFT